MSPGFPFLFLFLCFFTMSTLLPEDDGGLGLNAITVL